MNNINPIITKLELSEVDNIIKLQEQNNNILLTKSSIIEDLNNGNSVYYVAKLNNKIIGYAAALSLYDHIDILGILVDTQYLKQGIATTLLSYILNYAKTNNIYDILLEVRKSNIAAQKLYEKFGFTLINIRKEYYSNNLEDALIYKLTTK